MRAIILAAGRGSRMQKMTEEVPKCLIKFNDRPLIEWQLEALQGAGITSVAIVTGYKRELVKKYNLTEFFNHRWAETNMVSSLACAEKWLNEQTCIVSYSDIIYLSTAVESLKRCQAPLALTYDPNWLKLWQRRFKDPLIDAETFRLTQKHEVVEIGGKPTTTDEIEGQYMGLLSITPRGWQEIKRIRDQLISETRDTIHMTGILQKVIDAKRVKIEAVKNRDFWGEIDTPSDLEALGYPNGNNMHDIV